MRKGPGQGRSTHSETGAKSQGEHSKETESDGNLFERFKKEDDEI